MGINTYSEDPKNEGLENLEEEVKEEVKEEPEAEKK